VTVRLSKEAPNILVKSETQDAKPPEVKVEQ